ncbi:hypothetical protein SAMN02745823_02715 [Sporobacter termitidis DSM 10068]|uniref:Uncharacterized protein n=1 Tax=Sporobacter termitidis DSM 10068 TaxID=1123282 RepID=A0A1M5YP37_9FIRM|nr:hypothetical protein [Sporobacter termitidis]SHI13649.1 hypothetical protein SAMN02745823_02715 [Sporobacter termitidis DSM 10068]
MSKELTVDDIYSQLYTADNLLEFFEEQYFTMSDKAFNLDDKARTSFLHNYERMRIQLHSISNILFGIRVQVELALGVDSAAVLTHIRKEQELLDMYNEVRRGMAH